MGRFALRALFGYSDEDDELPRMLSASWLSRCTYVLLTILTAKNRELDYTDLLKGMDKNCDNGLIVYVQASIYRSMQWPKQPYREDQGQGSYLLRTEWSIPVPMSSMTKMVLLRI